MKICSTCGIEKPITEFNKRNKTKDGRSSVCKKCKEAFIKQDKIRHKKEFTTSITTLNKILC